MMDSFFIAADWKWFLKKIAVPCTSTLLLQYCKMGWLFCLSWDIINAEDKCNTDVQRSYRMQALRKLNGCGKQGDNRNPWLGTDNDNENYGNSDELFKANLW